MASADNLQRHLEIIHGEKYDVFEVVNLNQICQNRYRINSTKRWDWLNNCAAQNKLPCIADEVARIEEQNAEKERRLNGKFIKGRTYFDTDNLMAMAVNESTENRMVIDLYHVKNGAVDRHYILNDVINNKTKYIRHNDGQARLGIDIYTDGNTHTSYFTSNENYVDSSSLGLSVDTGVKFEIGSKYLVRKDDYGDEINAVVTDRNALFITFTDISDNTTFRKKVSLRFDYEDGKYEFIKNGEYRILKATQKIIETSAPSESDALTIEDTAPDSLSESAPTDNQSAGDTVTTASVESVPAKFEVGKSYLTRGQHLYKPLQVKVIERGEHYIIVQKFEESYISDSECKIFTDKDGNEYAVIYKSNQIELAEVVSAKFEVESIQQSAGIFASYIAAYDSLVAFIETYGKTLSTKDDNLGKHLKGYRKIARLYKDSAAMVGKSEQPLTGKFEIGGIYPSADICYTVIKRSDKFITFESISTFSAATGINRDKKVITRKAVSYSEGHEVILGIDATGRLDSMVDLDVYEARFHCRRISDLEPWEIPADAYKNAEFVTVADDYEFDADNETIDATAEIKPATLMIAAPTDNQSSGNVTTASNK